jgi:hypothetical protein
MLDMGKRTMNAISAFLAAIMAALTEGAPLYAAPAVRPSVSETASDAPNLRLPDPHEELRRLSKNLKLTKDQRLGLASILEERAKEIQLLLDFESLSQDYRNRLAAKIMKDCDAQMETLLKANQRRKLDKELARNPNNL